LNQKLLQSTTTVKIIIGDMVVYFFETQYMCR